MEQIQDRQAFVNGCHLAFMSLSPSLITIDAGKSLLRFIFTAGPAWLHEAEILLLMLVMHRKRPMGGLGGLGCTTLTRLAP